jgi:P pilus assembly chaperone PapD
VICRLFLVLLTLSAGPGLRAAFAQTAIEASPLRVEIEAEPGARHTQAVTLRNPGAERVRVRAAIADWHLTPDGAPQFEAPATGRPYAATSWVRFAPPEFTLEAGKEGTVRFTIDVPADAQPAGYRTALLFEFLPETPEKPSGSRQVILRSRIASLIYVNVGTPAPAVEMTNLEVRGAAEQTQIVAALKNSSRHTIRTRGTLKLYDQSGVAIAELVVPNVPLLPESERELVIRGGDKVTSLLAGNYRVELRLDVGMPAVVVGETDNPWACGHWRRAECCWSRVPCPRSRVRSSSRRLPTASTASRRGSARNRHSSRTWE